ncbi:MAG: helix-turn-helix transcriptional regulator [Ktedonobacterales bacterium]
MSNGMILHTLADWRRMRFMDQFELASKIGVSNHTISNWERGHKKPSPDHMRKLTEVLNVQSEQIVFPPKGEENPAA